MPAPALPALQPREDPGGGARRGRHRNSRRHRIAALRRRRRRHVGTTPSLEQRIGRAGRRQYRRCGQRRHAGDRHDRTYRNQYPRRRARPGRRHAAFALPADLRPRRDAAGRLYPARGARRRAGGRRLGMADKAEFGLLLRTSLADAVVLLSTFLLTVFVDLLTGIGVGVLLGSFLFMHRMAEAIDVQGGAKLRPRRRRRRRERAARPIAARRCRATSWSIASAARSSSAPPRA